MTDRPRRDWRLAGCAALLAAFVAFPLGMMFGGGRSSQEQASGTDNAAPPMRSRGGRDFYSPNVLSDPYVLEQHLRVVEALERSCANSGEHCNEARQARKLIEESVPPNSGFVRLTAPVTFPTRSVFVPEGSRSSADAQAK